MTKTDNGGAASITTDELRKLLDEVTPGEWVAEPGHEQQNGQRYWQVQNEYDAIMQNQFCWAQGNHESNARLIALAPHLARRVIAAEKLMEAVKYDLECWPHDSVSGSELIAAIREYEESK